LLKLRVTEIADGGQVHGGHAYQDFLDTAHTEQVPIETLQYAGVTVYRTDENAAVTAETEGTSQRMEIRNLR
jgi:hypothetical protein